MVLMGCCMAILRIAGDKEAFEKQIEDFEDQKKIVVAKADHYEKEAQKLKKLEGFDLWDKDLADWVKILANLTADIAEASDAAAKTASVVETSKAAEAEDIGAGAGAGAGGAVMGDEDRIDKT
ncbi:hypothetical protein E3N88_29330 [Mikania micrantha]|uniref:Uncharacterized protein n=1 Tax=Mikania micrantha TaxID=192012 RepID=A0A5N6MKL3_9ASTR|nr:hypothetical protein E3N88_29330 [Mikania micrantha]